MPYFLGWLLPAISLIILIFWTISSVRYHLFWVYLWQLKDYHIGRFKAHFATVNGRHVLFNSVLFAKFVLFLGTGIIIYSLFFRNFYGLSEQNLFWILPLVLLLYIFEGLRSLVFFFKKTAKSPQPTFKVIFLLPIIFIPLGVIFSVFTLLFLNKLVDYNNSFDIYTLITIFSAVTLAFDILTPLIVSAITLILQPITVLMRNRIIKRAITKRKTLENLLVIGITGSYGKSSVKEFLKVILSESFKVVSTEKNRNSEVGISETILGSVNNEHEIFICEMGAYNRGGIKLLTKIAQPKIGVLTGIGNQHQATFGSQKNIIKGKLELIEALPEEGLAVLNWDSKLVRDNFKSDLNSIKYGINQKEDIWAENIIVDKFSVSFDAVFKTGGKIGVKLDLIGKQSINNLLAAIAIGKRLGMENTELSSGISKIENKGLKIKQNKDKVFIANSSYSSNTDGVLAHLDYLKLWERKKIFVMPCIIELGSAASQAHYEIGKQIGEVCDYLIVTTADYFKDLKRGAIEKGMSASNIILIQNPENQYQKIINLAQSNDIIFLEGRVSDYLLKKLNV